MPCGEVRASVRSDVHQTLCVVLRGSVPAWTVRKQCIKIMQRAPLPAAAFPPQTSRRGKRQPSCPPRQQSPAARRGTATFRAQMTRGGHSFRHIACDVGCSVHIGLVFLLHAAPPSPKLSACLFSTWSPSHRLFALPPIQCTARTARHGEPRQRRHG